MEDKVKIIDLICQRHPSIGVDKGWSYYVGGMRDTGEWYFRKMLDAPLEELVEFLNGLIAEERKPKHELTPLEEYKSKIIIKQDTPETGQSWMTQLTKESYEDFWRKAEKDIMFGKPLNNSRYGKQ